MTKTLAEKCADAMWVGDSATQALDMKLTDVRTGHATMTMEVKAHMANGHGLCHGGYIFILADSAFAYACNSHNHRTVAQHCSISFLRPGKLGDTLIAVASEHNRMGRSGIYDVTVSKEDGTIIAEFRGLSRTIDGLLVETKD